MVEQRKQARGWHEYFAGFRANCESVPRLAAGLVQVILDDQRRIPYLLVWRWLDRDPIEEALRVSPWMGPFAGVELKRQNGSAQVVRVVRRRLPRNGGTSVLFICEFCSVPCRYLYGWSVVTEKVVRSEWKCRSCADLRYRSEGTYLRMRRLGGLPRTPPWDPWISSRPLGVR
jgi:hypothetical protein